MARPSKLTDKQWADAEQRHLKGESIRSIAKLYKVAESTIRDKVSARVSEIKAVANQIVAADAGLRALPVSAQVSAISLADELKAVSGHLLGAARFGASTAHRLAGIANSKVAEIDDAAPIGEESMQALKGIAVLTRMANESSEIGINLLRANKETVDDLNKHDAQRSARLTSQALPNDPVDAARTYMEMMGG